MSSVDEANGLDKESDDRTERWESSGPTAEKNSWSADRKTVGTVTAGE